MPAAVIIRGGEGKPSPPFLPLFRNGRGDRFLVSGTPGSDGKARFWRALALIRRGAFGITGSITDSLLTVKAAARVPSTGNRKTSFAWIIEVAAVQNMKKIALVVERKDFLCVLRFLERVWAMSPGNNFLNGFFSRFGQILNIRFNPPKENPA